MTELPADDYAVRADMLRLLNAFGNPDATAFDKALDNIIENGNAREVLSYLTGTTYGLFVCFHGFKPTADLLKRELDVAEEMSKL